MELLVEGSDAVVFLTGEIDIDSVREAEQFLLAAPASAPGATRFVLDLSRCAWLDSVGLGLLVSVRAVCRTAGLPLVLRAVPPRLMRVLTLAGLDTVFEIENGGHAPGHRGFGADLVSGRERPPLFPLPERATRPPAPDERLDRLAELTRRTVGAPHAFVSLLEKDAQVMPGRAGDLGGDTRRLPLSQSICQHVVTAAAPLVLDDTRTFDPVGRTEIPDFVGAYAGMPITDHAGRVVGSLCVMDSETRHWDEAQLDALADLADAASSELQLRAAISRAAIAADRERFAEALNEDVFGELLSLSSLVDSARAGVTDERTVGQLAEVASRLDDVVKRLRASLFDRG